MIDRCFSYVLRPDWEIFIDIKFIIIFPLKMIGNTLLLTIFYTEHLVFRKELFT